MATPPRKSELNRRPVKWLTIGALVIIVVASFLYWNWIWGLIFWAWAWQMFTTGTAFLVEEIERDVSPVLFWILILMWFLFGAFYLASAVWPEILYPPVS